MKHQKEILVIATFSMTMVNRSTLINTYQIIAINTFRLLVLHSMLQTIAKPTQIIENGPVNDKSILLTPVSEAQPIKHISALRNCSAPGCDGITIETIKAVHMNIVTPLSHIINLVFQNDDVPRQFRTSIIAPIVKSGEKPK